MSDSRPIRVLHIIDALIAGGSERFLWDLVRLSNREQVVHRVVTVCPLDASFVYAERLRRVGAYRLTEASEGEAAELEETEHEATTNGDGISAAAALMDAPPARWKRPLRPFYHAAKSAWNNAYQAIPPTLLSSERAAAMVFRNLDEPKAPPYVCLQGAGFDPLSSGITDAELVMNNLYAAAIQQITEEYLDFRADVIHGHTFQGFLLGLFVKLIFRRPMIYQIPALFSQLEDAGSGWLPNQYKQFHPWVDRFFTAYPSELLGIGVPAEKICHLGGGVDIQAIDQVKSERKRHRGRVRRALKIGSNTPIALSVGRLHSSKGHQYALEAIPSLLRQFPNLHWVVLGEGTEQERASLATRAQELGVQQHIHILGFVPDPLPFYAAADIYFRTPVFEAENLSSNQAMAMGLPVIGFDTETETELIRKVGHGALVPTGDVEALATAASHILSLPDRGRALGELGAHYCRAHLDLQHTIGVIAETYTDLHQKRGNNFMFVTEEQ